MNAPVAPLTSADIAQQVDGLGQRQDVYLRAQALAAEHLATLDTIPLTTDSSFVLAQAHRYRARVRQLARFNDAGMLGENGIGPAIADVAKQAAFHGFGRSARS